MKRIHYAWIEQILSFDSENERAAYIDIQEKKAARKNQPEIQIMDSWRCADDKRFYLRIRKPYNNSSMPSK